MSTLTTRIAGYEFRIDTTGYFATGMFVAPIVDGKRTTFMDLPYELRSTYEQAGGQTLRSESWTRESVQLQRCTRWVGTLATVKTAKFRFACSSASAWPVAADSSEIENGSHP